MRFSLKYLNFYFRIDLRQEDSWPAAGRNDNTFPNDVFDEEAAAGSSRHPRRRPQPVVDAKEADRFFRARAFRERARPADEAASSLPTLKGTAFRWPHLLLARRSPTLPDSELSSMLQNYLDESCHQQQHQQHQQQQQQLQNGFQFRKLSESRLRCQENFSRKKNKINSSHNRASPLDDVNSNNNRDNNISNNINCNSNFGSSSSISSRVEKEDFSNKTKMNFDSFESQLSTENVTFSQQHQHQTFQSYCHGQVNVSQLHHLQEAEACHNKTYHHHQQHLHEQPQERSLLLLPNLSPSSMDSGYGGPGSVGSLHSSSSTGESPMHSGSNLGSFPSSPWAGNGQEYQGPIPSNFYLP